MEIDKKKVTDGLKTAANIGYNVAKTGASVAKTAAPVVNSLVNGGLNILSQLLSKTGDTGTANGSGGADYNSPYTPSSNVTQLGNQVNSLQAPVQKPSQYQDILQQTMDAILNKEDFKYDMNADALYQQYKDQYRKLSCCYWCNDCQNAKRELCQQDSNCSSKQKRFR